MKVFKLKFIFSFLFLAIVFLVPYSVSAKSFTSMGHLFPIAEKNMLQLIKERLSEFQKSGRLTRLEKEWKTQLAEKIERSHQGVSLPPTKKSKTWYFDPSITVSMPILDQNNHVIISTGKKINPLQLINLSKRLVFYDASDAKQISWAKKNANTLIKQKIIITDGSVLSQIKLLDRAVYFDQNAELSKRFHLKHLPSIITQTKQRLKIMEVVA